MNDDIVTQLTNDIAFRLRLQAKISNLYEIQQLHMVRVPTIYEEAADEIERLRKLVTTWIICAERLVESNEGEAYEKALAFYLDCQRIAKETC